MRTNVRIGNDIKLVWQILEGGVPVNLTNATDIKVSIAQGGTPSCDKIEITTFEIIDAVNGMISVEVQKEVITELGYLWTVLEYTVPDSSMIDGNRKVTVDNVPVRIVAVTAEASQGSEFTVSSDIQAGFQGKSAYEVWLDENPDKTLEDYFDWLQQPATDIATEVSQAEALRVQAEQGRVDAEIIREQQEADRQTNTATAIADVENATENANTAAQNADNARLAIQTDLGLKLDKSSVKQVLGASTTDIMSQKAVTDEIAKRSGLIYEYVHSDNIEIRGFTVDLETGTFTKASHGLSNGDGLRVCLNQDTTTLYLKEVTFAEYVDTASMIRYVVNATDDTFQLSRTPGGAVETLTAVAGTDLTKWHFEKQTSGGATGRIEFEGLNALSGNAKNIRVVVTGKIAANTTNGHLYFNIDDPIANTNYIAYLGSGTTTRRATYTLLRADAFGTIEYDCTYNGNNLVIRKSLLMIREQDLTAYTENQLFYRNKTGYTVDRVAFTHCGFTNGLTIQIYKQ